MTAPLHAARARSLPVIATILFIAAVGTPRAAEAIPACVATDIAGSDPGCPVGTGTCTITLTYEVGDLCTLNFGERDVVIATNAELDLASNSVTIKSGSMTIQPRGSIAGSGNVGPTFCLETTRNVHVQRGIGSGVIDVSGDDIAGCLSINAAGSVIIDGNLVAINTGVGGIGGEIVLVVDGNLTTGSSSEISVDSRGEDSNGGTIDLVADGNVQLAGPLIATGAEGGTVSVAAGMNLTTGEIDARATPPGANMGGAVDLAADLSLTIADNINVVASGPDEDSAACGGSVEAEALFGDLTVVSSRISATGSAPDGLGGCLILTAAGDLNVNSNADLVIGAEGVEGCGGSVVLDAGIDVNYAGSLDASGGLGGGGMDIDAERRISVSGIVDVKGRAFGSFGGSINVTGGANPASQVQVTGLLDASGGGCNFDDGCGTGGEIDVAACTVLVPASGRVFSTGGDGGNVALIARKQMIIAGRIDTTTPAPTMGGDGSIALTFPNGSPPILTGADIDPTASLISRTVCMQPGQGACLIPCPTCGNGALEFPETCDLGNPNPVNCNGCSSGCRTQVCNDGLICTADMCDPRLGCFAVPPATPCAEPTRTPTITQTPSLTPTPTITGTPTLTGTSTLTPTVTPTPLVTDTPTGTPTPVPGRPGDADCDGVIDSVDFRAIVAAIFDPTDCPGADVNEDGRVTAADPAAFVVIDPR